jgi:hypothetical protein
MDFPKLHCEDVAWIQLALENSAEILITCYTVYYFVPINFPCFLPHPFSVLHVIELCADADV